MRRARWFLLVMVLVLVGAGTFAVYAWRPAIAAVDPRAPRTFDPALVQRGAVLAQIGNCAGCHSAPGQPAYAGGVPVETPFGVIHGTNITPDPDQGLGLWSEVAFIRAMRDGVDREGRHLYPAFPYDHFTKVTDEDDRALYAFLMTRAPARAPIPANTLPFPLNLRFTVAGWKLLFFHPGVQPSDPARDQAWNHGAYLVEGLGHCGACHTPRNALGAEERDKAFGGGHAEGWTAYPLNEASPAPIPWTVDALSFYLAHGWAENHGVSRGPMAAVTANLAGVPQADLDAMGTYLVGLMGVPNDTRLKRAHALLAAETETVPGASAGTQVATTPGTETAGGRVFAAACASCHSGERPLPFGGLDLAKSTAVHASDPSNIVTVTLNGLAAAPGEASSIMPGFRGTLTDQQIVDLLAYLRTTVAGEPAWPDLEKTVKDARSRPVKLLASDGTSAAPGQPAVRTSPW